MAVRNFYTLVSCDGCKTEVGTGPQAKDGGTTVVMSIRDKGEIRRVLRITGRENDGRLELDVWAINHDATPGNQEHNVYHVETQR